MAHSTGTRERIAGGPTLLVSALMAMPYLGPGVAGIVGMRFLAVLMVSEEHPNEIWLLALFMLAYGAVMFLAFEIPLLFAAGAFVVSFAAVSVLAPRLEGKR